MKEKFDEFLEEVEHDIRQERYKKLWEQYGKVASYAMAGIIGCVAMGMIYHNHHDKKQLMLSDRLLTAQNYIVEGKTMEAMAVLDSMETTSSSAYGYLKDFQKASLLMNNKDATSKDYKEACLIYTTLKDTQNLPAFVKDLALLLLIKAELKLNEKSIEDCIKSLEHLQKEDNPCRFLAKELIAEYFYRHQKFFDAQRLYAEIIRDQYAPEGIRLRAQLMIQMAAQKRSNA